MKVYITGIAGFIGYHTAIYLQEHGHTVEGCDTFTDFDGNGQIKIDRSELLEERQIKIDPLSIGHIGVDTIKNFDVVLHLAAHAGVRASLANPTQYVQTNIIETQHLIDICTKKNVPIVYASSSSVAAGADMPFKEDSAFTHHSNPYSWTKYANECMFKSSGLPMSVGLRFFTVYGPWGRPDMALFSFANKIMNNEPIELYNFGNMRRDFTYVKDIVQGVYILLKLVYNSTDTTHEIYNIGYGKMEQLSTYVQFLEFGLNKTAEKKLVPAHPADAKATWSDITKIKALGYEPTTSIEDGVKEFTKWYKEYYNG